MLEESLVLEMELDVGLELERLIDVDELLSELADDDVGVMVAELMYELLDEEVDEIVAEML